MNQLKYHKLTTDEIRERDAQKAEALQRQQELIERAKKVIRSEDFQALKINYEVTRDKVVDELIKSVDAYTIDELGMVAFQFLHRIKYLRDLIKSVETKAQ